MRGLERQPAYRRVLSAFAVIVICGLTTGTGSANDRAHDISQKFALEAEAARKAADAATETKRKAAVADDAARKKAAEAKRRTEAQRAEAARKAAEAERRAREQTADEAAMLEAARAELEDMRKAEAEAEVAARQASEEHGRAERERVRLAAEAEEKAEAEARARVAARKEADAKAAADAKALADVKAAADAKALAEAKAAADAKAVADVKAAADAKALAEAKAAADAKALAEAKAAADAKAVADVKAAAEKKTLADAKASADAKAAETRSETADTAETADEKKSRELAEKLSRVREARMPSADEVTRTEPVGRDRTDVALPLPPTPPVIEQVANQDPGGPDNAEMTRVTVLLVIAPGRSGFGPPRTTADPILCVGDTCFISRGADQTADKMPRNRAFGTGNTVGGRAGACNNQTSCVFRNVELGRFESEIQPIDMRFWRHDRRDPRRVRPDWSCTLGERGLVCRQPAVGPDYRAWLVPETVAQKAGGEGLAVALARVATDR